MSEFISRKDALEHLCAACFMSEDQCLSKCWQRVFIEKIPAADVRPVVRGKWLPVGMDDMDEGMYKCSECGSEHFFPEILVGIPADNFCPNCGADMREES